MKFFDKIIFMNPTDELLYSAFRQLLAEKPYRKITVRDIVDRCHVNRNTFYYHFSGIPDLMDHYLSFRIGELLKETETCSDPFLALVPAAREFRNSRPAVLNLRDSAAWPSLLRHMAVLCRELSSRHMKASAVPAAAESVASGSRGLSGPDHAALTRFYSASLYGCLLTWLENDMDYDLGADLVRVSSMLRQSEAGS
ncbi:MAG: TetR/AcrR family transcriptional regulator [Stomatobaculum sp.]|nr:TetR/AcrR family transcriptional regulator [Stomatobaculum sp.]